METLKALLRQRAYDSLGGIDSEIGSFDVIGEPQGSDAKMKEEVKSEDGSTENPVSAENSFLRVDGD